MIGIPTSPSHRLEGNAHNAKSQRQRVMATATQVQILTLIPPHRCSDSFGCTSRVTFECLLYLSTSTIEKSKLCRGESSRENIFLMKKLIYHGRFNSWILLWSHMWMSTLRVPVKMVHGWHWKLCMADLSQISPDRRNQNLKLNSCSFQLVDSATAFPLKIECQIRVFYAWESVWKSEST